MTNLNEICEQLNLKILTEKNDFSSIPITSGYTSDMLSCVMAGAKSQGIWVTLMAHNNIVAVASLLDIPAIIITEDAQPSETTITLANNKGVALLSTPRSSFDIVGLLYDLGLRGTL